MTRTVAELERDLAEPTAPDRLGSPDLAVIHRLGTRRRRARRAAVALGSAVAVAAVSGVGYGIGGLTGGDAARDLPPAGQTETPKELSPLAERVLRQVPGAVQVSPWQVVIPGPGEAYQFEQKVAPERIVAGPRPLGTQYVGVTAFKRSQFPGWLYDEVERIEQEELGDDNGYPVGSTEMGILVEYGDSELACVGPEDAGSAPDGTCSPAVVAEIDGDRYYQWGMGTDDFLEPGADMEVFTEDDYSRGTPGTIAIAGIDGTDVASADFYNTAGEKVGGVVEAGSFVPDDSIFFANVPGELARVVAYDADGEVIEDHPLKACDGGVDCEVR
jgi:hypothetical protein